MSFLTSASRFVRNHRTIVSISRAVVSRSFSSPIILKSKRSFSESLQQSPSLTPKDDGDFVFAQTAYKFDETIANYNGPVKHYDALAKKGIIIDDEYQREVVKILQNIYDNLIDYYSKDTPAVAPSAHSQPSQMQQESKSHSSWGWFKKFSSSKPSSSSSSSSSSEPETEVKNTGTNFSNIHNTAAPVQIQSYAAPKGIYIWGGPGCGKTYLMDLLFNSIQDPHIKKARVDFHSFMLEINMKLHQLRQKYGARSDPLPEIARNIASRNNVLFFDEFQVTDVADAMMMQRLFSNLFSNNVTVISTSNREPDDLYRDGVQRDRFVPFIHLLKKQCPVLHLNSGRDYRFGGKKEVKTYFYPPGPETNREVDALFEQIAGGKNVKSGSIDVVQGRKIHVNKYLNGVCEFTFDELCRKPAGASDYISICNQFHTMVLKGIPVFTMDSMTELRRFITLIDELYQYKVKLICTTEAPLPELFKLNRDSVLDEVFACDRTISRLEEMQTVHYLQTLHFLQKPKLVTVDA